MDEGLVIAKHAAYLLIVNGNQPALRRQLATLPWREVPVADTACDRGHGRAEGRRLRVTTIAGLDSLRRSGAADHPPGPAACQPWGCPALTDRVDDWVRPPS
jgi:hypothetical protein